MQRVDIDACGTLQQVALLAHALATVALMVGVRSGVAIPVGSLTAGRPVDRVLGPGVSAELDVGASLGRFLAPYAFVERTWFGCGDYACDGASWLLGAAMRLQTPQPRGRLFVDLGAGYRTLEAASIRGSGSSFLGTSAGLSFFQRQPSPRFDLAGVDVRVALGTTLALTRGIDVDLIAQLSVGRFARWTSVPESNFDPNVSLVTEESATHAVYSLALGVHFAGP